MATKSGPKVAWKVVREVKAPQEGVLLKQYIVTQRNYKCADHKAGSALLKPCVKGCKLRITRGTTDAARVSTEAKTAARDYALTLKTKSPNAEDEDLVSTYIECLSERYADRANDSYRGEAKLSRNGNYGDPVEVVVSLMLRPLNLYWMVWRSECFTHAVVATCKYCYKVVGSQYDSSNTDLVAKSAAHYYECAMIRHWQRKEERKVQHTCQTQCDGCHTQEKCVEATHRIGDLILCKKCYDARK